MTCGSRSPPAQNRGQRPQPSEVSAPDTPRQDCVPQALDSGLLSSRARSPTSGSSRCHHPFHKDWSLQGARFVSG